MTRLVQRRRHGREEGWSEERVQRGALGTCTGCEGSSRGGAPAQLLGYAPLDSHGADYAGCGGLERPQVVDEDDPLVEGERKGVGDAPEIKAVLVLPHSKGHRVAVTS